MPFPRCRPIPSGDARRDFECEPDASAPWRERRRQVLRSPGASCSAGCSVGRLSGSGPSCVEDRV
eukprot:15476808-Alexandrium_andersonii.AAC.1